MPRRSGRGLRVLGRLRGKVTCSAAQTISRGRFQEVESARVGASEDEGVRPEGPQPGCEGDTPFDEGEIQHRSCTTVTGSCFVGYLLDAGGSGSMRSDNGSGADGFFQWLAVDVQEVDASLRRYGGPAGHRVPVVQESRTYPRSQGDPDDPTRAAGGACNPFPDGERLGIVEELDGVRLRSRDLPQGPGEVDSVQRLKFADTGEMGDPGLVAEGSGYGHT